MSPKSLKKGVILASLAILSVWCVLAWHSHEAHLESSSVTGRQLAFVFREYVHRAVRASDLSVMRLVDRIGTRPLSEVCSDRALWDEAVQLAAESQTVAGLFVTDASGATCLNTNAFPPPPVSLADRRYFEVHSGGRNEAYVGPAIEARTDQGFRFTVSRPLLLDGAFRGVVVASVKTTSFESLYKDLDLDAEDSASVYNDEGYLVVRNSQAEEHLGKRFDLERLGLGGFPESRQFRKASEVDGTERIYSAAGVPEYGFIATVGLSVDRVNREWWQGQRGGLIAFIASLLLAVGLLVHAIRNYEKSLVAERLAVRAADEKDALFSEIHHRVGNNMQVITSFLMMKQLTIRDPEAQEAFTEAIDRIRVMGLVHRVLYSQGETASVDMAAFLDDLAHMLGEASGAGERGISIEVDAEDAKLDISKAVPLGLIANEVVTNSLKHAFDGRGGRIHIAARMEDGTFIMTVADDGKGIDEARAGDAKSSGLFIVDALAKQVGGTWTVESRGGLAFRIAVPLG